MRIVRYLRESKVAVALIVVLLLVQAFTDLSLPHYTSQIVDVGIQQSGIEHPAVERMTPETFEAVSAIAQGEDADLIASSYRRTDDGLYERVAMDEGELARLDGAIAAPLVTARFGMPAEGADALVEQQAVFAAKAELEAAGVDVGALQLAYLAKVGATMAGLAALGGLASIGVGYLAARTAAKVGRGLRERLFRRVVAFSDAEVGKFSAASLITRGTNDIQQIQNVTAMMLRMVLYAPILALGGIVMVSRTNVSMSWIIVLAVACLFVVVGTLMAFAMPKFKAMQSLIDRVNLVAREMLTGLSVVRAFGRQDYEARRFDAANRELADTQLFTGRAMAFMMPSMMLIMNGISVLVVWVGGSYIDAGTIQTGDMIAFITYSMVIIMSFLIIGMISIMLPRADVAAQRVNEVLETAPSIEDPTSPRDAELAGTPGASVSFDDVSFAYDGKGETAPALEHVSFEVPAGAVCAIVGSTGSGKTTALKLIERFFDVTEGAVCVDGIDVRELTQAALRRTVAYVPQQAFLFSGTVADNVAYADETMGAERVRRAVEVAQAAEFVDAKAEGLDFEVSQGGTNVSGGQRQRLCIARALASDARVLLFDDSFSALDYRTDAALRAALRAELAGRTLVIVAQRVSTVMDADAIVVLDEGRMVGVGTHRELLASCAEYREIARSQLSEDELEGGDAR